MEKQELRTREETIIIYMNNLLYEQIQIETRVEHYQQLLDELDEGALKLHKPKENQEVSDEINNAIQLQNKYRHALEENKVALKGHKRRREILENLLEKEND